MNKLTCDKTLKDENYNWGFKTNVFLTDRGGGNFVIKKQTKPTTNCHIIIFVTFL